MGRLTPGPGSAGPGAPAPADLLFAYGSLARDLLAPVTVARLRGYRRGWGVAADNRRAIPGYKRYRSPADGSFPALFVAFLDLVEDPATTVNGVLAAVDPAALADIDRRERNYDRIDVTAAIESPPAARVWAYVGSAAGRRRFAEGAASGRLAVQRDYLARVDGAFRRLGATEHELFRASSDLDGPPVLDLERVDLPPEPLP